MNSSTATDPVGQNIIKLISNVCFSSFVFAVLIFTVIAITYQPPDPWLQSSQALTRNFLSTLPNSTFQTDDSVIRTGEDLIPTPPTPPPVAFSDGSASAVANVSIAAAPGLTVSPSDCSDSGAVNCSDPRVLIAVRKFNVKIFKSIIFIDY